MSESLSEDGINQEDSQEEDVMTPAELISKLEEVRYFIVFTQFLVTTRCFKHSCPSKPGSICS